MADAREREGAVEVDIHFFCLIEEIFGNEFASETEGGAHGSDGMGAGGAYANFEEFEQTGIHGGYCRGPRVALARLDDLADFVDFLGDFFFDCLALRFS